MGLVYNGACRHAPVLGVKDRYSRYATRYRGLLDSCLFPSSVTISFCPATGTRGNGRPRGGLDGVANKLQGREQRKKQCSPTRVDLLQEVDAAMQSDGRVLFRQ